MPAKQLCPPMYTTRWLVANKGQLIATPKAAHMAAYHSNATCITPIAMLGHGPSVVNTRPEATKHGPPNWPLWQFEYRLETTVSDHFKLCKFCHQTKPPCRSGKNWCHVLQERQQREDRVRAAQATRRYGALTLASIGSRDPRVEQAMLMGPPPLNPAWGKGKGKGRR